MFASDLSDAEQESLLTFMDSGKSHLDHHDHNDEMAKRLLDATLIFSQHLHKVETRSMSTQTDIISSFDTECQTTAKWVAIDKGTSAMPMQLSSDNVSLMSSSDSIVNMNKNNTKKKKKQDKNRQSMPAISMSPYADMSDAHRLEADAKKVNVSLFIFSFSLLYNMFV